MRRIVEGQEWELRYLREKLHAQAQTIERLTQAKAIRDAAYEDALNQLAALSQKERRQFAWAEEYMGKSRALEMENERLRSSLAALREQTVALQPHHGQD
jgi:hypothetical protein